MEQLLSILESSISIWKQIDSGKETATSEHNNVISIIIFILCIVCIVVYYLSKRAVLKKNLEFLNFVKYIFSKKFSILPKICLELDSSNRFNNLKIDKILIEYNYNMTKCKFDNKFNMPIDYPVEINYSLDVTNFIIPKRFGCYFTNSDKTNNENALKVEQMHGKQTDYSEVSKNEKSDMDSRIRYYSYTLDDRRKIRKNNSIFKHIFKMFFKITFKQEEPLLEDRIILYPKQFAKKINEVEFKVKFLGEKLKLTKIEAYKIYKEDKGLKYHYDSVPHQMLKSDEFSLTIKNVGKTENIVYYINMNWEYI